MRRVSAEPRSGTARRVGRDLCPFLNLLFPTRSPCCFAPTDISGWTYPAWIGVHEQADKMTLEIDFMNPGFNWSEAHSLAAEGPTNDPESSTPTNITALDDTACRPSPTVSQLGQPASIAVSTLAIEGRGHLLLQGLMGALVVVIADKMRRSLLLAARRGCRRRSHLRFINSVHLLMSSVVLGAGPTRKFHADAQTQPPSRKTRQIQRSVASKGSAVIDTDNFGLSKFHKQPLEMSLYRLMTMAKQSDAQQVAAEQIAYGQGVHPLPVSRAKPAFEIDRPNVIGSAGDGQGGPRQLRSSSCARTTGAYKPKPPQPFGDGSHLGQVGARMRSAQTGINLLCAPMLATLPHLGDFFEPTVGSPPWRVAGTSRTIQQSGAALGSKTRQPFETSFSTDTQLAAQLSNRVDASTRRPNKALTRLQ